MSESCLSRKRLDVVIVGAGPAGAWAAFNLARRGCKVALIEKEALPRYKVCGGGLLHRAYVLIKDHVSVPVSRPVFGAELIFHDKKSRQQRYAVSHGHPLVYMTMRDQLDNAIVESATEAGVELYAPQSLKNLTREDGVWIVECDQIQFESRFVIAADGVRSGVKKILSLDMQRNSIPAIELEVDVPSDVFQQYADHARFDVGCIDKGYGWVFPKRDHLSVGVLSTHRGANVRQLLQRYLDIVLPEPSILHMKRYGFVIPNRPMQTLLAQDGVLFVGDAAGLADPLTAEGLSHALMSGQFAAQAITESASEASPRTAGSRYPETRYQSLIEENILSELRIASRLAGFLYSESYLQQLFLSRAGQGFCNTLGAIIRGEARYREILTQPGNYLKLLKKLSVAA